MYQQKKLVQVEQKESFIKEKGYVFMDKNRELQQVNALKTIMMFCVVLYHSILASSRNGWGGISNSFGEGQIAQYIADWLNMFHVEFFAFASGYLFYMMRYEKGKYRTLEIDINNRFKRLMIPVFVISVLWAIPAQLIAYGFSWSIILKGFVLQIAPAQLWFLPMLFLLYVVFYLLSDHLVNMSTWKFLIFYFALYVGKIIVGRVIPLGIFQISSTIEYSLYYYLGFAYRRDHICKSSKRKVIFVYLSAVLFAAGYLYWTQQYSLNWLVEAIRPVICCLQIRALLEIGSCFKVERLLDERWFKLFTVNSMGIYLLHQQLLYLRMRILPNLSQMFFIPVSFIIVLFCSYFLTGIIRKTKLGKVILGG